MEDKEWTSFGHKPTILEQMSMDDVHVHLSMVAHDFMSMLNDFIP